MLVLEVAAPIPSICLPYGSGLPITRSSSRSATTAFSCSSVSSLTSGCACTTRAASSAKSIFSTASTSSMRDSGMSPLAKMRLMLDSAIFSSRARVPSSRIRISGENRGSPTFPARSDFPFCTFSARNAAASTSRLAS